MLKEVSTITAEGDVVEITSVTKMDGMASVSVARGKRKTPFDFTFEIAWQAHLEGLEEPIKGGFQVAQCSNSAAEIEVELALQWKDRAKAGAQEKALLGHLQGEFQREIEAKLAEFAKEFAQMT
jgi:hypothetical protein